MDPTCRLVLQMRMLYLLENLEINPILTAFLTQSGTLNDHLVDEINAKVTKKEKIECLIQKLKRRGSKAFQCFMTALLKSEQGFIADDLKLHKKNEETKCDLKIQEILSQYPALQRRLSTAQDIPELKRLFAVREDLVQARKENMDLQDIIDDMKSEMSKLQRHLEHYKQEVEEKEQELDLLNTRLDEVTGDNEQLQKQVRATSTYLTQESNITKSSSTYLENHELAKYASEATLHGIDEVDPSEKTDDNLTKTIEELQLRLKDKDDELHNIKQEHQTLLEDLNKQFGHLQEEVEMKNDGFLATGTSALRSLFDSIAQTILPRQDSPILDNPLQELLNKAQGKITGLERKVESLKQAKQKLRTRLNKSKKSLSLTQTDVKRLDSQIVAEQEHNKTLQSILANSRRRESTMSNSTVSSFSSDENKGPCSKSYTLKVEHQAGLPMIKTMNTLPRQSRDVNIASIKVPIPKTSQPLKLQTIRFIKPS